jgi:hypothetical protein
MIYLTRELADGFALISPRFRPRLGPPGTMIRERMRRGRGMWERTPPFGKYGRTLLIIVVLHVEFELARSNKTGRSDRATLALSDRVLFAIVQRSKIWEMLVKRIQANDTCACILGKTKKKGAAVQTPKRPFRSCCYFAEGSFFTRSRWFRISVELRCGSSRGCDLRFSTCRPCRRRPGRRRRELRRLPWVP